MVVFVSKMCMSQQFSFKATVQKCRSGQERFSSISKCCISSKSSWTELHMLSHWCGTLQAGDDVIQLLLVRVIAGRTQVATIFSSSNTLVQLLWVEKVVPVAIPVSSFITTPPLNENAPNDSLMWIHYWLTDMLQYIIFLRGLIKFFFLFLLNWMRNRFYQIFTARI